MLKNSAAILGLLIFSFGSFAGVLEPPSDSSAETRRSDNGTEEDQALVYPSYIVNLAIANLVAAVALAVVVSCVIYHQYRIEKDGRVPCGANTQN
jgi:hypothetical protein